MCSSCAAASYQKNAFFLSFNFLRYIEKLQKYDVDYGEGKTGSDDENLVKIMSIHKSKGLEFPVVFLSGTGKNFNLMDTKTPLIIHSDYYVGAKYIDTDKRCGNDTFSRKAFASLMVTESISEELRILYVALTRAKEKCLLLAEPSAFKKCINTNKTVARQTWTKNILENFKKGIDKE